MDINRPREVVDGLTRINAAKIWPSFYGNAMSMEFDVWLDGQSLEREDLLAEIFNNRFSNEQLKTVLENCHYKLKYDDFSDNWFQTSVLGQQLDQEGFRMLALIERVKSFNFETMSPAMKCTLLIGNKTVHESQQETM